MPEMRVSIRYALSALSNRWRCLSSKVGRRALPQIEFQLLSVYYLAGPHEQAKHNVDVKACYRERCQSVEPHLAPRVECAHRGATHVACAAIPRWRRHFQHPAACRPCERRRP
jgi:hypothetical protein